MLRHACVWLVVGVVVALVGVDARAASPPEGQLTIAFDTSITPTYLDPAETTGIAAPFVFLYALHDALLKPLPGNLLTPCLAEALDGERRRASVRIYAAAGRNVPQRGPLHRRGCQIQLPPLQGHLGQALHDKVKAVEVIDAHRLRFVLHASWPDFLTFYATPATGAAWIVPKKYIEQVGDDGQAAPAIGPAVSLPAVGAWGRTRARGERALLAPDPVDQTHCLQGVPERPTRLAMLKTGEADLATFMIGDEGRRCNETRSYGWR